MFVSARPRTIISEIRVIGCEVDGMTKSARKVHEVCSRGVSKDQRATNAGPGGRTNVEREGPGRHGNGTAEPHGRTGDERRIARPGSCCCGFLARLAAGWPLRHQSAAGSRDNLIPSFRVSAGMMEGCWHLKHGRQGGRPGRTQVF